MSELAEQVFVSRSRLTYRVDRLTEVGFVVREECQDDRRGLWAILTETGRQAVDGRRRGSSQRPAPADLRPDRRLRGRNGRRVFSPGSPPSSTPSNTPGESAGYPLPRGQPRRNVLPGRARASGPIVARCAFRVELALFGDVRTRPVCGRRRARSRRFDPGRAGRSDRRRGRSG